MKLQPYGFNAIASARRLTKGATAGAGAAAAAALANSIYKLALGSGGPASNTRSKKGRVTATRKGYGTRGSFSKVRFIKKRNRKIRRTYKKVGLQLSRKVYEQGQVTSSEINKQAVMDVSFTYDIGDINAAFSLVDDAGTTVTEANTRKIFLNNVICKSQISNPCVGTQTLWIYDLVVRRDVYAGDNDILYPRLAWNKGLANSYKTPEMGNSLPTYEDPFSVPQKSGLFNIYWRVVKKTKFILAPGECVNHTFIHKPNKMLSKELLEHSGLTYIKGVTSAMMVVAQGQVGFDNGVPVISPGVGFDQTAVNMVYSKTMNFSCVRDVGKRQTVDYSQLNTTANGQMVIMGEAQGIKKIDDPTTNAA